MCCVLITSGSPLEKQWWSFIWLLHSALDSIDDSITRGFLPQILYFADFTSNPLPDKNTTHYGDYLQSNYYGVILHDICTVYLSFLMITFLESSYLLLLTFFPSLCFLNVHYFLVSTYSFLFLFNSFLSFLLRPMKQIAEVEKKPFTSSLNICPEAFWRKGWGRHPPRQQLMIFRLKTTQPSFSSSVFPSCSCLSLFLRSFLNCSHTLFRPLPQSFAARGPDILQHPCCGWEWVFAGLPITGLNECWCKSDQAWLSSF